MSQQPMESQPATAGATPSEEAPNVATEGSQTPKAEKSALRGAAMNGSWGGVGAIVASALGFGLTAVVARGLGPHGAGLFFAATALVTILIGVGALGADTGLLWALPRDRAINRGSGARALLRMSLAPVAAVGLVLGLVCFLLAPEIAGLIGPGDLTASTVTLRVLSVGVALGPLSLVLAQATRALGNVKPFVAFQQMALPGLRVAGVLVCLLVFTISPTHLAFAWSLPLLLVVVGCGEVVRRRLHRIDRARESASLAVTRASATEFWKFSLLRGLANSCSLALTWLDVVLVAILAGPTQAGFYAAASRFATSGQLALQAMRLGIAPQISAAFARNRRDQVQVLYATTTGWAVALSWPVFVILGVFAPVILGIFGHGFEEAATPLRILCLAMMFNVATGNVGTLLLMSGRSSWALATTAIALGANVALDLLLIPRIGAVGAAIGWTVAIVLQNYAGVWLTRRHFHVNAHDQRFWVNAAYCLVIPGAAATVSQVVLGGSWAALAVALAATALGMLGYLVWRRHVLDLPTGLLRPLLTHRGVR